MDTHLPGNGTDPTHGPVPLHQYLAALPDWKAWAVLHIHDEDGRILLLHAIGNRGWQHPGGHTEQDEAPHETAERETLEETGHKITALAPLAVVITPPRHDRPGRFGIVFDGGTMPTEHATRISLDPDEHDDARFATLDQWRHLLPPDRYARLQAYDDARRTGRTVYLSVPD